MFAGIGTLLILIVVSGWIGLRNAADLNRRLGEAAGSIAQQIEHSDITQVRAGALYENAIEMIAAGSQKDSARLNTIETETAAEITLLENELGTLNQVVDEDIERETVAKLKTLLLNWKSAYGRVSAKVSEEKLNEAAAIVEREIKPSSYEMTRLAKSISDAQYVQMTESKKRGDAVHARGQVVSIVCVLLSVLTAIAFAWVIRTINRTLRETAAGLMEGAEQTASASAQVSSSSQSLAQGASEQAASLEETSASSEEINSTARKNTDNSRDAAGLVLQSQQKIAEANQSLEEMIRAMVDIKASSDKISQIIKTIDEIAFQTNILALNAAVEAARAGVAGMGFAVVADEVRNLAQRCAQAARDTSVLIEESIARSKHGQDKVDLVAAAIRSITEGSGKVKVLVDEVNASSEEQARGIDQISKAMTQMEQVTQRTAASAEECASAAEELSSQSEAMKDMVERLTAMVGSGGAGGFGREQAAAVHDITPARRHPSNSSVPALRAAVKRIRPANVDRALAHAGNKKDPFPMDEDFKEF